METAAAAPKHSLFCRLLWTLVLLFYGTEGGLQICKRFFFWIFLLLEHSFTSCLLNSIECIIKSSYPMEAFLTSFPLNIPGQKVHYMGIWFCMPNECDWIIRYTLYVDLAGLTELPSPATKTDCVLLLDDIWNEIPTYITRIHQHSSAYCVCAAGIVIHLLRSTVAHVEMRRYYDYYFIFALLWFQMFCTNEAALPLPLISIPGKMIIPRYSYCVFEYLFFTTG